MAVKYHPMGDGLLSSESINFHARNSYQVLGYGLDCPSEFLIVWCKDEGIGGTSQAIRIARDYNIPIYNLDKMGNDEMNSFWLFLKGL